MEQKIKGRDADRTLQRPHDFLNDPLMTEQRGGTDKNLFSVEVIMNV